MGGGTGPLRLATPQGLGFGGQHRPSSVGGAAWPRHRGAMAAWGFSGSRLREAPSASGGTRLLQLLAPQGRRRATAARGLSGGRWAGLLQPAGGAPSAGGGAGQWPLASSIYGGWRVSS